VAPRCTSLPAPFSFFQDFAQGFFTDGIRTTTPDDERYVCESTIREYLESQQIRAAAAANMTELSASKQVRTLVFRDESLPFRPTIPTRTETNRSAGAPQ
jgi:hypothetical protein